MPHTIVGQTTPLNCGAACLLCAALELGAVPIPPLATTVNGAIQHNHTCMDAIYRISSDGLGGLSMPGGVLAAAAQLGMHALVIAATTKTVSILEKCYPSEMARIVNNLVRVSTKHLGDLALKANERAMHCVRIGDVTPLTHWVLQRDDNSYMDPAGGANQLNLFQGGATLTNRTTLKHTGQSAFLAKCYHGTGLAVKLRKI